MHLADPLFYETPRRCCDDERDLMMERAYRELAEQRREAARRRHAVLRRLMAWSTVLGFGRSLVDRWRPRGGDARRHPAGQPR